MYQSYNPQFYMSPYGQEVMIPIELDQRQFGGGPMGPPSGPPPFGPPGTQPPFGPPGQGPSAGPPTSPPPSYVPMQTQQQAQAFAIDPGSIRRCLFRYTYVWMRNRQQFWFYPVFVGRQSVSGWRWTGFRWVFYGTSLRQITSFTCI